MTNAARSIFVYGLYLLILSVTLIVIPNVPLSIFGIPTTNEVWIRIVGVQLLALGVYFVRAGRGNVAVFFPWTIPTRITLVIFLAIFVAVGLAPINLLLLAPPDIVFVVWTILALRSPSAVRPMPA
jgi:hypothetical protein